MPTKINICFTSIASETWTQGKAEERNVLHKIFEGSRVADRRTTKELGELYGKPNITSVIKLKGSGDEGLWRARSRKRTGRNIKNCWQ